MADHLMPANTPMSARPPLPVSDGGAITPMAPVARLPRRRSPSSDADVAMRPVPSTKLLPAASEPNSDGPAGIQLPPEELLRESSEPNVTGAEAIYRVTPIGSTPTASGHTIQVIRELHRQRQDLLRTEGDLTRRIKAIQRRSGQGANDDQAIVAAADAEPFPDDVEGLGPPVNQWISADDIIHPLESGEGHGLSDIQTHDADVALTPSGEGGHYVPDTLPPAATFAAPCLVEAQAMIKRQRMVVERLIKKQAETLPIFRFFVEPLNGMGSLGLAQIIGEAGDLGLYANPAKLWKRMGLGLVDGERQRKHTDAAKAAAHGYSPIRRSTMFSIGDSLIKKQNPYREVYLARKVAEVEKAEAEGLKVAPAAKIPRGKTAEYRSEGHIHRRAQRYMEKRLLRDLWRAWQVC